MDLNDVFIYWVTPSSEIYWDLVVKCLAQVRYLIFRKSLLCLSLFKLGLSFFRAPLEHLLSSGLDLDFTLGFLCCSWIIPLSTKVWTLLAVVKTFQYHLFWTTWPFRLGCVWETFGKFSHERLIYVSSRGKENCLFYLVDSLSWESLLLSFACSAFAILFIIHTTVFWLL